MYMQGGCYIYIGQFTRSLSYFDRCIEFCLKYDDFGNLIDRLMWATMIAVLNGETERAKKYFNRVEIIYEENKSQDPKKLFYTCYIFAKANILKTSSRFRSKVLAVEFFKEIFEKKAYHANLYTLSLIFLCELLLDELRLTNDESIVKEIEPLNNNLLEIAQSRKSYLYLAESFLLQGKMYLVTFRTRKARRSFLQAQRIAERHNLDLKELKILLRKEYIYLFLASSSLIFALSVCLNGIEGFVRSMEDSQVQHAFSIS
ncbi:unnamed protein product, partial [marine sediment metagenome]